ncbi:AB14G [Hepatospora eriocheir]|uniref:AB14G n=1 Tax=Hepatospora eriocheir TaxID=1081669 RepID=A0A1X0QI30_9MICR|nr:AB14G [Hepatospora eriocheir]
MISNYLQDKQERESQREKERLKHTWNQVKKELKAGVEPTEIKTIIHKIKTQSIQLTFSNINVITDKEKFLVKGVAGTVKPGKIVGLLGPLGCGKTTLMNAITGLIDKNLTVSGKILLNNELINSDHQSNLIAYYEHKIPEYENIPVITQVEYAASLYNKNPKEVASGVINEFYLTKEKEKEYQSCSRDQQIRISMATNLTTKASIYILDEPLTGLDSFLTHKVLDVIKKLSVLDKTILLSVHQPSESIFNEFDEFILMTNGSIVFQGTKDEAIKYFASIGFINEEKLMLYSDFFLKIITLEKNFSDTLTIDAKKKYHLLVMSWRFNLKELKIEYTEPIKTKFKKFSMIKKAATMLMCNLFSFHFFFNILLIIIPNIYSFFSSKVVENVQLTRELKKYISSDSDLNKNYKNYLKKKMLCLNLKYHLYSNIYDIIGLNKPYKSLWNDNPILVICSLLFYRFFFLSLFEFKLFYKSIEKHKVEYKKGYFGVVGYLLASYLISIREFIIMIICDIITFIYFTRNLKMLSVLIIFYLLTLNFIYLICLSLSISFNTMKFYLLSGIIKFILSSILIYFNSILNMIIWRVCTFI